MRHWKEGAIVVVVSASIVIAGCVSAPFEAGEPNNSNTVEPDQRLIISKWVNDSVTVSMYEHPSTAIPNATSTVTPQGEKLASVTYPQDVKGEIHVTEFEPDGHIVISVGGEVAWQGIIASYSYYELSIESNGEVRVVESADI